MANEWFMNKKTTNVLYSPSISYPDSRPKFTFGAQWGEDIVPMFKDLRSEMLHNTFARVPETDWNMLLMKCGTFLTRELRQNGIELDHLLALKLYTDFTFVTREFRKSYQAPFSENKDRLRSFIRWRQLLEEAFVKFTAMTQDNEPEQPKVLYHGIKNTTLIKRFTGTYYGPTSTTTDLSQVRDFADMNGMILVLKPKPSKYKMLSVSWISRYLLAFCSHKSNRILL